MFKKICTYDLDGVLIDSSHRYRNKPDGTIDLDYWFKMRTPKNVAQDSLLPMADKYKSDLANSEIFVIICTSRMRSIEDMQLIKNKLGLPDYLLMRPLNNFDADAELKHRQLVELFNNLLPANMRMLPRYLYEDNPKNIRRLFRLFDYCELIPSTICERAE